MHALTSHEAALLMQVVQGRGGQRERRLLPALRLLHRQQQLDSHQRLVPLRTGVAWHSQWEACGS